MTTTDVDPPEERRTRWLGAAANAGQSLDEPTVRFCLAMAGAEVSLMADQRRRDLKRPAEGRRAVQTVLAETVAAYAATHLHTTPADVLDAAANAAAAERAPTRPAGWAEGRDWRADLLHQHAQEMRAADTAQTDRPTRDDYEATTGHAITCGSGFGMGCQCNDEARQPVADTA